MLAGHGRELLAEPLLRGSPHPLQTVPRIHGQGHRILAGAILATWPLQAQSERGLVVLGMACSSPMAKIPLH